MARVLASNRALAVVVALTVSAAGCAGSFEREYDEAERLRTRAAEAGYEWIETEALLQQALDAHAGGDAGTAQELVRRARFQAEAAIAQADAEAEAWKSRVVR